MICGQSVHVETVWLKWQYETKHSNLNQNYSGEIREQNVSSLVQPLNPPPKKQSDSSEQADGVSFEPSHLTVKSLRLFTKSGFIKSHLLVVSQKFCCTNCVIKCEAIVVNRMTIQRPVADISEDIETQLSKISNKCVQCSW